LDLIAALSDCAQLLLGFGGHKAAAGFSIDPERIPDLRAALSRAVAARGESIEEPALTIDAYVELPDLSLDLVTELRRLAPFGPGNPPLTLVARDLVVVSQATIGRTQEHLRITVEDVDNRRQTVFWWQGAGWPLPQGRFDLACQVGASDYRGETEVQVEWVQARQLAPIPMVVQPVPRVPVRDYRGAAAPGVLLDEIRLQGPVQIWAEGDRWAEVETVRRHELVQGSRLVIWNSPPSPGVLQAALGQVRPVEIIVFAVDQSLDERQSVQRRLAGVAKHALRTKSGEVDLERAAAALAQTCAVVKAGLDWLDATGTVMVREKGSKAWWLAQGDGQDKPYDKLLAGARLDALLAETAAYRDYLRNAPESALVRLLSQGMSE
jgi:single-stranded-DNA-specific exonuclease